MLANFSSFSSPGAEKQAGWDPLPASSRGARAPPRYFLFLFFFFISHLAQQLSISSFASPCYPSILGSTGVYWEHWSVLDGLGAWGCTGSSGLYWEHWKSHSPAPFSFCMVCRGLVPLCLPAPHPASSAGHGQACASSLLLKAGAQLYLKPASPPGLTPRVNLCSQPCQGLLQLLQNKRRADTALSISLVLG